MRLIDADALIADSCRDCPEELMKRCKTEPACADTKFLFEIPTVDAVPVVRCKECKWTGGDFVCYRGVMVQHKPEDFCSYGERRGGGEDD